MEYEITIIVLVYNVENYIERCIRSLLEQTLNERIQYVIVNDCTPDRSIEILHQIMAFYPERIPDIKIINHDTNKGSATARNTGLMHATGRYIGWVDSDDWVEANMFEKLYDAAQKHNADLVWCDFYNTGMDSETRQFQHCKENKMAFIQSVLTGTLHGGVCFSIVRKEIYSNHAIRFPDGLNVMEDKLVLIKLAFFSEKITHVPFAYYHYEKDNTNSLTTNWDHDLAIQKVAMTNLQSTFDFLNHTALKLKFRNHIRYAKLIYKKNLLNSLELKSFQRWRELFKEANNYVLCCPNMTLRQKILGLNISLGWWMVAKIWIHYKKRTIDKKTCHE